MRVSNCSLLTVILDGGTVPVGLMNAPICKSVTKFTNSFNLML